MKELPKDIVESLEDLQIEVSKSEATEEDVETALMIKAW
ncbi:hypothetical protein N783_04700 [Pontibacillus marinus BH030004 = DSM 16465]|uniref:Uncharacterized protein n=1 Tax=Pontibacillus marinus BH030004 = DSM 16465 TaxID=1385511 RepID=A0A0A5GEY4_9BACI|nr:hypothetical protein N783_04700 [Pontibacillus marinus BH030004 = DSM 16465]